MRQALAQLVLRNGDALVQGDGRSASQKLGLGLLVEHAQQLALPSIPDARADSLDVADGQDEHTAQPFDRPYDLGEHVDGSAVGQIAHLGDVRHHQMVLDEPADELHLALGEAEAFG